MAKKWTNVKPSRPHRQPKHKVKGYNMTTSDPHRNKGYKRRPRRTDAQIKAAKKARKPRKGK